MRRFPVIKWVLVLIAGLAALLAVLAAGLDWNWLREPIARRVEEKTGRPLVIAGNLKLRLGWGVLHVRAGGVSFGNPAWAKKDTMLKADDVSFSVELLPLLGKRLMFSDVELDHGDVFLEENAAGQKNWLLDPEQKDEKASVGIARLKVQNSQLSYERPAEKTAIQAEISTSANDDVRFTAHGEYKGMPLTAHGTGGPALALRDEREPYPFTIDAAIGGSHLQAAGSITGLSRFSAVDIEIKDLQGDSVAQLYPLLGLALPETPSYRTSGHLTHHGKQWGYEKFSGQIGDSAFSGTLKVTRGSQRPLLQGDLEFRALHLVDLGPTIGARPTANKAPHRVLPAEPFQTKRWQSVDADIRLSARSIIRPAQLPIEDLTTHLQMRDAVLKLDPLEFGVAGGKLGGSIVLDGRQEPIRAQAKIRASDLSLKKLLPTADLNKTSLGRIDGQIDLSGTGDAVADMLGSADGSVGLVVAGGQVSRLMMEMAGLHLLEVILLRLAGDEIINIRCGIADFAVKKGRMQANALIFDTAVTNVTGDGSVDFRNEQLDLVFVPKSKEPSLISLQSPLHVRGSFSAPAVEVDKGRLAARGLGALALGAANPLLALLPLVDSGAGQDSDCGRLISQVQAGDKVKTSPRP
ncbi:MAG: AsmA family protein [Bacteroidota bacterium]